VLVDDFVYVAASPLEVDRAMSVDAQQLVEQASLAVVNSSLLGVVADVALGDWESAFMGVPEIGAPRKHGGRTLVPFSWTPRVLSVFGTLDGDLGYAPAADQLTLLTLRGSCDPEAFPAVATSAADVEGLARLTVRVLLEELGVALRALGR
jgi:hypothetical protein